VHFGLLQEVDWKVRGEECGTAAGSTCAPERIPSPTHRVSQHVVCFHCLTLPSYSPHRPLLSVPPLQRWGFDASTLNTVPMSRRLLAVPFIGKDSPSPSSEFANPEVVIGLTLLAYRYEGLRVSDVTVLISHLQKKYEVPFPLPSSAHAHTRANRTACTHTYSHHTRASVHTHTRSHPHTHALNNTHPHAHAHPDAHTFREPTLR
jgi:hypothetical protein